MRIAMACGRERLEFEVPHSKLLATAPAPAALADPAAAVRAALEAPFHNFPPLRRALTPDDHLAVLVDEQLPGLGALLVPLLEHVLSAGVAPERVTLLLPPGDSRQEWVDDLPDEFQDVRIEVHDPANRQRLCYLATTAGGKRLYLNRTLVEADQVIALTGRRYDPLLGRGGAEGAIYPALGDEQTRQEMGGRLNFDAPGAGAWPARREAQEVVWLLGLPFFVQCIAGAGDTIAHVLAGTADASAEGGRLLDASWRRAVARPAQTVVASLAGEPSRHTFADLAGAAACAARVVQPEGRIVLLTRARPDLGPAADLLRHDDPQSALGALRRHPSPAQGPALQWARAASHAKLSVLSDLPDDTVEELFATPLQHGGQVQRLLDAGGPCLFLEDAHKALAVVDESAG